MLRIFVFEMKNNIKLKGVLLEVVGTKTEGNTGLQSFDSFLEADIDLVNKKNFGFQERGFDFYSKKLKEANKKEIKYRAAHPATYKPLLLGITQTSCA